MRFVDMGIGDLRALTRLGYARDMSSAHGPTYLEMAGNVERSARKTMCTFPFTVLTQSQ